MNHLESFSTAVRQRLPRIQDCYLELLFRQGFQPDEAVEFVTRNPFLGQIVENRAQLASLLDQAWPDCPVRDDVLDFSLLGGILGATAEEILGAFQRERERYLVRPWKAQRVGRKVRRDTGALR